MKDFVPNPLPVIISSDNRAYALVLLVALKVRSREGALYERHNMPSVSHHPDHCSLHLNPVGPPGG